MAMKDVFLNNEYLPTLNEFVKLSSQQALSEENTKCIACI